MAGGGRVGARKAPAAAAVAPRQAAGSAAIARQAVSPLRDELLTIYKAHAPENVDKIDTILSKFKGREQELLGKVQAKYLS